MTMETAQALGSELSATHPVLGQMVVSGYRDPATRAGALTVLCQNSRRITALQMLWLIKTRGATEKIIEQMGVPEETKRYLRTKC